MSIGLVVFFVSFGTLPASAAAPGTASSTSGIATTTSIIASSTASVIDTIESYFADVPVLEAIATCESHNTQFNDDGTVYRGKVNPKDVGVMQINERFHLKRSKQLGYNIYTLEGNLAYAKELYQEQGVAPWSASAFCWGRTAKLLQAKVQNSNTIAANLK